MPYILTTTDQTVLTAIIISKMMMKPTTAVSVTMKRVMKTCLAELMHFTTSARDAMKIMAQVR